MRYEKKPISLDEQVQRLRYKGLHISDEEKAKQCLHNISYYRLRAYTYPFQDNEDMGPHMFLRSDISLDDIIDLYSFDRSLRSLVFSALERIEVALRSRIVLSYSMGQESGFWFLNEDLYFRPESYQSLIEDNTDGTPGTLGREVDRCKEDFVEHYYHKYGDPSFPPAWMTLETISFGTLSKLFSALDKNNMESKEVTRGLGLHSVDILRNWMHALAILRNTCAHHGRLWNRRFTIGLTFPYNTDFPFFGAYADRIRDNKLFAYLSATMYLLRIVSPENSFRHSLEKLLAEKPTLVSLGEMGFPKGWKNIPVWRE